MIIDCRSCAVRGAACADCVVTYLTIGVRAPGEPGSPVVELDDAERAAIVVLASSSLVPPLRLVPRVDRAG